MCKSPFNVTVVRDFAKLIFHQTVPPGPLSHFYFFFSFKGSVSQILRWVLLYINWKLSLRPIIASNNISSLLKGHFTINKKQSCAPMYGDIASSRQYWQRRQMWVCAILKCATAPLSKLPFSIPQKVFPILDQLGSKF